MADSVVLLALFAAVLWGIANYVGGCVGRKAGPTRTAFGIQVAVFLFLLPTAFVVDSTWSWRVIGWGLVGSLAGLAGFVGMYAAMAGSSMGVVTKLVSSTNILVPLFIGVLLGERPTGVQIAGIAIVLISIAVLSWQPRMVSDKHVRTTKNGVLISLASGAAFGLAFCALGQTNAGDGSVVLMAYRFGIALMLGIYLLSRKAGVAIPPSSRRGIAVSGVLSAIGDTAFVVALQHGTLSVVPAIVALHPGVTALSARIWSDERLRLAQGIGIAVGLVGVLIIKL